MSKEPSVLVIDDEEVMRDVISRLLEQEGIRVLSAARPEEGLKIFREELVDVVLLDLMLPGMDGLKVLEEIFKTDRDAVVIMITAYASIENAVKATKLGAFQFITKPFKNEQLLQVVKNGLEKRALAEENRLLKRTLKQRTSFHSIIGKSEQMQRVFDLISQVGPGRSTVLIYGESGTGKELVAKAVHHCSPRAEEPFVPVNSGTIPSDLLESELFGHTKGAFTGATSAKKGLFEVADGGTLFLDEVGTVPMETQAKLLRVIQEREFRPVGGLENKKVDVRIIAATNVDLRKAVDEGEFREDLFYRLNVISIHLPPLRDRRDDIPLLVDHFVRVYCEQNERDLCSVDQTALRLLMEHSYPGNVRELENIIERAVVLAPPEAVIDEELLPPEVTEASSGIGYKIMNEGASLKEMVQEFEKSLIVTALKKTDWNQKKAASILRVNPTTLNEKLKRLEIRIPT
ncbi:MAG TPA: sigma-54 dependent transcriptional regulator [Acidobacteriota bacterium]|nr:sigma-54 dependent transcriptional regulator [Acidobacteriota bacterium]